MSVPATAPERADTPAPGPPRVWRWVGITALAVAVVVGGAGAWGRAQLTGSLARLDGEARLPGLVAPVSVERDALGVPTIRGANRADVARALGYVHAQERFFQMDLLRRKAAGELAALVGGAALPLDRAMRLHRLRLVAEEVVRSTPDADARVMESYAAGVDAGLADLAKPPFEYLLLGAEPEGWAPEDTILCVLAMFVELHDETARTDAMFGVMRETLPPELLDFLTPLGTAWDAPVVGEAFTVPPIPGPEVIDLRGSAAASLRPAARVAGRGHQAAQDVGGALLPAAWLGEDPEHAAVVGSNNWAVAGGHTATGAALVADDMHLPLGLPNIWYRASLAWATATGERRLTGVTLPGTPAVVAGSNGDVAWGFTNSQGDWSDLVVVEVDPDDPNAYRTPGGMRPFERHVETLAVRDAEAVPLEVRSTIWGPIVGEDADGRPLAVRWTAHEPEGVNFQLLALEASRDLEAALDAATRAGIPPQNFVAADATGRIGWTLMGRIPRRVSLDGRWPESWADGTRGWDGWLATDEYPRIVDPPNGRLWTANARVVDGDDMRRIGLGHFVLGARAQQIRDGLLALESATAQDMLRVQLDDRAVFLTPWRDMLLELLAAPEDRTSARRAEAFTFLQQWGGRASVDSVGYRVVRAFRSAARDRVLAPLLAPCLARDPEFDYTLFHQYEGPLWRLVSERPAHLLEPGQASWESWLLAILDDVIAQMTGEGSSVPMLTWGAHNTVYVGHPLSRAVPALARWLDVPPEPLPGDRDMPRVQTPSHGASERFAVSPGRESEGLFHMPGGQSGHPLSPFYLAGHEAWARGEARPFLPGSTVHTLRLVP